jgi:hypothetical protein
MPAPTLIQEAETAWDTTTTPKTTGSVTCNSGDTLVAYSIADFSGDVATITNSGAPLVWTLQKDAGTTGSFTRVRIWTATMDTTRAITFTFALTGGGQFGGNVFTWRTTGGIGASSSTNAAAGAPTLNITTTGVSSAVMVVNGDFTASSGARTWRTGAGAFTEQTFFAATNYTAFGGYHANAGAINTYAVGMTTPTPQDYTIAAIEILGVSAAAFDANLGNTSVNNTGTAAFNLVLTTSAAAAALTRIVVVVGYWTNAGPQPSGVSDSGGAYTRDLRVTHTNLHSTLEFWSRAATAGLASGQTITVAFPAGAGANIVGGVLMGAMSFTGLDMTPGAGVNVTGLSNAQTGTPWTSGSATATFAGMAVGGATYETGTTTSSTPTLGAEVHDAWLAVGVQGFVTHRLAAAVGAVSLTGTLSVSSTATAGGIVVYSEPVTTIPPLIYTGVRLRYRA